MGETAEGRLEGRVEGTGVDDSRVWDVGLNKWIAHCECSNNNSYSWNIPLFFFESLENLARKSVITVRNMYWQPNDNVSSVAHDEILTSNEKFASDSAQGGPPFAGTSCRSSSFV